MVDGGVHDMASIIEVVQNSLTFGKNSGEKAVG